MTQEVKIISISDLVLWTENPRDPIDLTATDQNVVDRALANTGGKWNLQKLALQMGDYYDFSELPTIVYHGGKPVVYDGNRRIVLAKIKLGLVIVDGLDINKSPNFPSEIPCNVCAEEIALRNVYRKHADSGTWAPLERDIFLHKFMGEPKSTFLQLDEVTGLISSNSSMNQRFVKEEIFKDEILNELGIKLANGKLESRHTPVETSSLLDDIVRKVTGKVISTRVNRGAVLKILDPETKKIIDTNSTKNFHQISSSAVPVEQRVIRTRRVKQNSMSFFGGSLALRPGIVSNLYRDINDLYEYYCNRRGVLSQSFPGLIRMSLRLIAETAAKDKDQDLTAYIKQNFMPAKERLSKDEKTTLANHNVTESSVLQLLHTGAHNYSAASSVDQALALSIILGNMLGVSHGKVELK